MLSNHRILWLLNLPGKLAMSTERPLRIVAILAAYNEGDIIAEAIEHLIGQGVETWVIDDGSRDDTVAIVRSYLGRGVIALEARAPLEAGLFDWSGILTRKEELATTLDADWFIHQDADEFRDSPWPGVRLADAIDHVDRAGFNAVNFGVLDFWPPSGDADANRVQDRLTHFAFGAAHNRVQIRCWKKTTERVDLTTSGGHDASFTNRRVFPIRFPMRHYPLRSEAHTRQKVLAERLPRYMPSERQRGWHVQYDTLAGDPPFLPTTGPLQVYDPGWACMVLMVEDVASMISARDEATARERSRCSALEALLSDTRKSLGDARTGLARLSTTERELRERLEGIEAERERLWTELKAMFASRSWRWTAFARRIAAQFGLR